MKMKQGSRNKQLLSLRNFLELGRITGPSQQEFPFLLETKTKYTAETRRKSEVDYQQVRFPIKIRTGRQPRKGRQNGENRA